MNSAQSATRSGRLVSEVLLGLICLNGIGCNEVAAAYYEHNHNLRGAVYQAVVLVERRTPQVVLSAAPIVYALLGGAAVVSIGNGIYISTSKSGQSLFFKRDF